MLGARNRRALRTTWAMTGLLMDLNSVSGGMVQSLKSAVSYQLLSGKCSLALVCSGESAKGNAEQAGEKAELPVCYFPNEGLPIQVRVRSKARVRGVCARLCGYAHAYVQMCAIPAKSKALANGDPRLGPPAQLGRLLSSHITDRKTSQLLPHSLWPLPAALSHCNAYYCPTGWPVPWSGGYPTDP